MPISVNGQLISLGGGGIGTWDPLTEPDKITAGENSSPGAFFLLNKMTNIIDDVAYASYGTLIFYDPEKERWQVGAGDEKNLGVFDNIAALQAKYPVGQAGQYALLKSTNTVWYWSTTTSAWVNGGSSVPADVLKQTDIVINIGSTDTTKVAAASLATLLDNLKVDKVAGYSLTKNDFTDALKTKLDGIQAGAEVNVQANWTETNNTQDNYIANLPRDANQLPNFYIKSEVYSKTESDTLFIENSEKAQPNGVATLDASGKVPVAQLNPAGVNYYPSLGNFPNPGFVNNVYLAIDTNIVYSWVVSTNSYKEIGDATILKTDDIVNTFDQTSIDKVASANTVKVLYDTKVEKVTGKQLSTEDYTTAEKTKLAGIQEGAEVNVKANWTETNNTLDSFIENKPLIINNLLSTSATDILSANQGNALDLKKIDKVPNYTDFLPKFNLDGSLVSSTKKTSDFEPANPNILKTTDIVDNLSGGDVGNTRQVLEASQGKVLKDQIDTKEPIINSGTVSQYWRGDKTWQSLNQNSVGISNRLITNVSQEVILSSLPTPDDTSDQNNVRIRVANTTVASTRGADLELQAGNGTDGSGDVVFYGSATPENAITVGANSGSSASSTTALSFSHTVTSVSDRLLIVQVVCSGGQQAGSATFASTPLTLAERTQSTTLTIETWYLVNPAAQTGIVQVNFTNPVNNAVARAINFNGVDQTTPIGQKAEIFNNNQTTSASLSLSTTLGQIVVDLIGTYNVTATLSGGQTQIWSGSTPQQEKGRGSYEIAQTPTTAVSYTFTSSSYAFHVIAINKVGGTGLGTITEFGRITASGIQSNGLILPSTAYTTAGTYTLTQQSTTKHKVYNSGIYNINLPKATYLRTGMIYEFSNRGTGSLNIRTQDTVQIATCPPNSTILLELTDNSTGYNGVWEQSYIASSGSVEAYVTSQKGVANGIAPLNSIGVIPSQYVPSVAFPVGAIMALQVSPSNFGSWLLLDGSAVSRTTYSILFLTQLIYRGAVTISQANPAIVTLASHGFSAGQKIVFTSTGSLPTGITANSSVYYVMSTNLTQNTFQISATYGGAAIATTTAGSGIHTLYKTLYGYTLGDGSNTFGLPNYAGRTIIGSGNGGGLTTRIAGEVYGAETHTLTTDEIPSHTHGITMADGSAGVPEWENADLSSASRSYASGFGSSSRSRRRGFSDSIGLGSAHNNMQPSVALPVFVYSGV